MSTWVNTRTKSIDWITFSIYLGLVIIGWMMVYAAGYDEAQPAAVFDISTSSGKQTLWIGLSMLVLVITFIIDHNFWRTFAYPIYGASILLLILVLIFGIKVNGSRSWFSIAGFTLQPSELAKFGTCLVMAAYLSASSINIKDLKMWLGAFGLLALPAGCILLQPDAGSALVFASFLVLFYRQGLSANLYIFGFTIATLFTLGLVFDPIVVIIGMLLFFGLVMILNIKQRIYSMASLAVMLAGSIFGVSKGWVWPVLGVNVLYVIGFSFYLWKERRGALVRQLSILLVSGSFLAISANYVFNNVLERHQQERINVWLKPSACDPQGSLYNVLQSKMAIGSGGLYGKGFLQGTMTKLNYVPEQMTDFIFCTVGEEQGFIGSLGIISLFFLLLWRIITIGERQRSDFTRNYAYGVAGILFIHFFVNIGMTMGIMPIIGIPLPFISKGGSSLLGFTLMIGVLLNLDKHRLRG